jgi:hypothetical protein
MEIPGLLGASIAFFGGGLAVLLYEFARIKADRPILKGGVAAQVIWQCLFSQP